MAKIFCFLLIASLLFSCKEKEENVLWQVSPGPGTCYSLSVTPDTGIVAAGTLSGNPFVISYDKNYKREGSYRGENAGSFTSVWADRNAVVAAGNDGIHPYIAVVSRDGSFVWDTLLTGYDFAEHVSLINEGDGAFVAICSPLPGESSNTETEIFFVSFNISGTSVNTEKVTFSDFISVRGAVKDANGNLYLAATRASSGKKTKSAVLKLSESYSVLWEKELYNNPVFGSQSNGIALSGSNIFITGSTELENDGSVTSNTTLAALNTSGTVLWKKYLEYFNTGSSVATDQEGSPVALNKYCFVINRVDASDWSSISVLRPFSACDPQSTDASGEVLNISTQGDYALGGTRGGNFYLALKSAGDVAPV
jgi:hypothetical protein